ncbi:hypothetical protein [Bradyrhizobium sp. SZCCHNR1093]|uniref:hypothetical protein n=1 Tax=Bradyrhizobium sp. SZCCHNR1093 TaxID=3057368 RepID=UPI0028F1347A|nr:hypothetical protein [Bradyrhizobium sp. SZCCHNR1093]
MMLKLSANQIDAIRNSELRAKLAEHMKSNQHLIQPLSELDQDSFDCLSDACIDVLGNQAPAIEEFHAEQDLGRYPVGIRGVPGAYFVFSADRDDLGVFSDLEEARSVLLLYYGEFIVAD